MWRALNNPEQKRFKKAVILSSVIFQLILNIITVPFLLLFAEVFTRWVFLPYAAFQAGYAASKICSVKNKTIYESKGEPGVWRTPTDEEMRHLIKVCNSKCIKQLAVTIGWFVMICINFAISYHSLADLLPLLLFSYFIFYAVYYTVVTKQILKTPILVAEVEISHLTTAPRYSCRGGWRNEDISIRLYLMSVKARKKNGAEETLYADCSYADYKLYRPSDKVLIADLRRRKNGAIVFVK